MSKKLEELSRKAVALSKPKPEPVKSPEPVKAPEPDHNAELRAVLGKKVKTAKPKELKNGARKSDEPRAGFDWLNPSAW